MAWLMARAGLESYAARAGFALGCGLLAAIATNVSYWNWYGFPGSYTLSYAGVEVAGMLAAGLVAAKVLGRPVAARLAATAN